MEFGHVLATQNAADFLGHVGSHLSRPPSLPDALCEMLFTPTLALFAIVFNFCAVFHIANNRNGHSPTRWFTIDYATYAFEDASVHTTRLGVVAPPPPASSPIYTSALHRAEWAYRSSTVRIIDFVEGSSKARTVPAVASPPSLPPSPTKPTDPITSADCLPPTLTSLIHPATFESFPTYNPSTPPVIASPVAWSLGLTGLFSCLVCTLIFTLLKVSGLRSSRLPLPLNMLQNRGSRQPVSMPRPVLTCNVNCQAPVEDFRSVHTATPIPSYAGSEVDPVELESEDSSGPARGSRLDCPTAPRTFPVVITNSDGRTLFNAEIKFSSNRVVTALSATSSTVSFSIDVVASLDVPTGTPL